MKVISEYLDSLFLTIPNTPETAKAKEDLLALMEDHYQALIAEGRTEAEAIGTVISEFGSIDELLDELNIKENEPADFLAGITLDETIDFWQTVQLFSLELGLGVAAFCWAISMMVLYPLVRAFSILGFFLLVAIGVGLIISGSLKYASKKKKMHQRPFYSDAITEAKEAVKSYEKSFRIGLVLGILAIVMSIPVGVAMTMLTAQTLIAGAITFGMIGLGVFLIIYTSVIFQHFVKVSRGPAAQVTNGYHSHKASDYTDTYSETDDLETRYPLASLLLNGYWFIVFLIYILWSRLFGGWSYTWVIFVLGGYFHRYIYTYLTTKLKK